MRGCGLNLWHGDLLQYKLSIQLLVLLGEGRETTSTMAAVVPVRLGARWARPVFRGFYKNRGVTIEDVRGSANRFFILDEGLDA